MEYRIAPRARLRIGIGDQVIDYGDAGYLHEAEVPLPPNLTTVWVHNAMLRTGFSYEAGPVVGGSVPKLEEVRRHQFLDGTNLALIAASLLGQTADAISTQRFEHHGGVELDALMRPFVNQGWPGQIGAAIIENTLEVSLMYALHRMGHHHFERAPPASLTVIHGYAAYQNLRFQ